MRRKFELFLTPEEVAAIIKIFDKNNDGRINCQEFIHEFFRMKRKNIDEHYLKKKEETYKLQKEKKEIKKKKDKYYLDLTITKLNEANENDLKNAYEKIKKAATFFKPNPPLIQPIEKSFQSAFLEPTKFREVLKNNLNIRLTPGIYFFYLFFNF
jgi:hypothetical protein